MQINLLYKHGMNNSRVSNWIPIRLQKESNLGRRQMARSLMIDWRGYVGANDASITVYATNNPRAKVRGRKIDINKSTNEDDAYLQYIDGRYGYIRVEYDKGSSTLQGSIYATLYYD